MLKPSIEREGQPFVDEAVYVKPNKSSFISDSVAKAFSDKKFETPEPLLVRHERVQLRWMKPGKNGKLVPA